MTRHDARLGAALLALALAAPALAGPEVTAAVGLRFGGDVDSSLGEEDTADPAPAFALTVDVPLAPNRWLAVLWSRQSTAADLPAVGTDDVTFDLTIDYLHAAGVYRPRREGRRESFVLVSLGVTRVAADEAGFEDDWTVSGAIGGGAKFPLAERWALRLEGRGYLNFAEVSLAGICGGVGCTVRFSADGTVQFEGLVGATFAF